MILTGIPYSAMDVAQKAKVHWDVEVDENTKFLHDAFFNYYDNMFQPIESHFDVNINLGFTALCPNEALDLQKPASLEEIKNAVWDCGSEKFVTNFLKSRSMPRGSNSALITLMLKVQNPVLIKDFCPISLFGIQYKIIAKLLANRLTVVLDKVFSPVQSAFISARQILDGPLMVSEIIDWYKKQNKNLMIFKVDFEKAFDSVSWRYLDYVLSQIGFGDLWRTWIRSFLHSACRSILINGSPTAEFSLGRSLRQGGLLSPFLFVLIMEGLHLALDPAIRS
uniref:RNA-directed DNA polymerase, eukaryota, reverse transcriptase zinc-binding domain protein n=1 Tax=Tanacetum cinerariifolium TaxID=118510 RepID=A0A699HU25_TANCI|nr:RNA-directed DNA polymerase, eukaryota, reverse transcriptase zinc-binding domain protein [Tanacetum cinerariifolium]